MRLVNDWWMTFAGEGRERLDPHTDAWAVERIHDLNKLLHETNFEKSDA